MSLRKDLSAAQQVNPPGSDKQVLFNASGVFTGSANFIFNTSTSQLIGAGSTAPAGSKTLTWGDTNVNNGSFGATLLGEISEIASGVGSALGCGEGIYISGYGGIAFGRGTKAGGSESFAGGAFVNPGFPGKTNLKAPQANGWTSFGWYFTDTNQTNSHGANADHSAILGGQNHNIPSDSPRSAIIGGDAIKARATDPDQTYVSNFNIAATPLNDNALTQVLVRDATTGQIKYRSSTTLGGGGGGTWGSITGTLSSQTDLQAALNLKANNALTFDSQPGNYTLVLSDANTGIIEINSSASNNVTVPPNSSVAFPIGTQIPVVQYGVGLTTIVQGSGVVIRSSSGVYTSPGQYSTMFLIKRATDEWYLLNGVPSFSNTAAANELPMSDGTNLIPSNVFTSGLGNLQFGVSTLAGNRTITTEGSASNVNLTITPKGTGAFSAKGGNANNLLLNTTTASLFGVAGNITASLGYNTTSAGISVSSSSGATNPVINLTTVSTTNTQTITLGAGTIVIDPLNAGSGGTLLIKHLPTSSSGLASGTVWNNSGVLSIIP